MLEEMGEDAREDTMPETTLTNEQIEQIAGKHLLTVKEASYLLGIHRVTVHRQISQGKIKICKIGRSTRIPKKEIERFIESNAKYRGNQVVT